MLQASYLLGLGSLFGLPAVELGLDLLNDAGDVLGAHRRVNSHGRAVLDNGGRAVVALGGSGSTDLLALLALLGSRKVLVLTILLLLESGTLEARGVNSTLGLGSHSAGSQERSLLSRLLAGVKEGEQVAGTANLLEKGGVAGLGEQALSLGLLALKVVALVLSLATLASLVTSLTLVGHGGLLLRVVVVLELTDGAKGLLLLGMELGALVTQAGEALVGGVLLGLDLVKLGLDLVVLLGHGLLLRVLHAVLDLLDLGAKLVNLLLRVVKLAKGLANLAQGGDVGKGLALVHELHGARVDLAIEMGDLAIDIVDALEGDLGLGCLLLRDAAANLLVETLDLVELGGTGILATGLLLADFVGLSNEFLATLLGGAGLVLVLAGHGNLDLGLDGVLERKRHCQQVSKTAVAHAGWWYQVQRTGFRH